jgi:hypothetical protein
MLAAQGQGHRCIECRSDHRNVAPRQRTTRGRACRDQGSGRQSIGRESRHRLDVIRRVSPHAWPRLRQRRAGWCRHVGTASLAKLGRQIFIAAVHKIVEFDIFAFYRGRHTSVGIDTLALSSIETADVLRELGPGFASGHLKPFPIKPNAGYRLEDAAKVYVAVLGSSRDPLS